MAANPSTKPPEMTLATEKGNSETIIRAAGLIPGRKFKYFRPFPHPFIGGVGCFSWSLK